MIRPTFYRLSFSVANKAQGLFTFLRAFFFVVFLVTPVFANSENANGYVAVKLQTLALFEAQSNKDFSQIPGPQVFNAVQTYQDLDDFQRSQQIVAQARLLNRGEWAAKLDAFEAKNLFLMGGKENLQKAAAIAEKIAVASGNGLSTDERSEVLYIGVLAWTGLGKVDDARKLMGGIPKTSGFVVYAYSALAENALQKKLLDQAIQYYSLIDSTALSKEARGSDIFSLSRLNLAKALNAKNQFALARKMLEEVPTESDFYPEVLMTRAYINLQIEHPEKYIESIALLNRAMNLRSWGPLFYQANLLSAFCFSKLGAVQKGGDQLQDGLKKLDDEFSENKRLSVEVGYFDARLEEALHRLAEGRAPTVMAESRQNPVFLTASFKNWVPRISRLHMVREENQHNLSDLRFLIARLEQNDFDPSLLKKPGVDSLFLSLDEDTVQQQSRSNPLLSATYGRARNLYGLLALGRTYSNFLIEGRKWDVTKQFLIQNAISARIKKMRNLSKQRSVIQQYFSGRNSAEPPEVTQLKAKIQQMEKTLFLEEKRIRDIQSIQLRLTLAERKLDETGRYAKILFGPAETEKYQTLRKQLVKQKQEAAYVAGLFETDKANKSWRSVNEQVAAMLNPEELQGIEKEIEGAKVFIAGVQQEDEKAKEEFSADLGQIQKNLEEQTRVLLRTMYLETAKSLLARHQQVEARLVETERDFRKQFRRDFLAEMTEENGKLLQFQSQMRFERARLSDPKTTELHSK